MRPLSGSRTTKRASRSLTDRATWRAAQRAVPPDSPTRIPSAAVACRAGPNLGAEHFREFPSSDLDSNLLLASEYVTAYVAFAEICEGHPAAQLDGDGMTRALAAVGKFGVLSRRPSDAKEFDPKRIRPGTISTEARALIRYYDASPSSTHAMFREAHGVPGGMVEAVLRTANRMRKGEAKARAARDEMEPKLRRAKNALAGIAAAAALVVFGSMIPVLGVNLTGVAGAFGLGALLLILLSLALHSVGVNECP